MDLPQPSTQSRIRQARAAIHHSNETANLKNTKPDENSSGQVLQCNEWCRASESGNRLKLVLVRSACGARLVRAWAPDAGSCGSAEQRPSACCAASSWRPVLMLLASSDPGAMSTRVGPYRIGKTLGTGSFSKVKRTSPFPSCPCPHCGLLPFRQLYGLTLCCCAVASQWVYMS